MFNAGEKDKDWYGRRGLEMVVRMRNGLCFGIISWHLQGSDVRSPFATTRSAA